MAPPKRLRLLRRSPSGGAVPNKPLHWRGQAKKCGFPRLLPQLFHLCPSGKHGNGSWRRQSHARPSWWRATAQLASGDPRPSRAAAEGRRQATSAADGIWGGTAVEEAGPPVSTAAMGRRARARGCRGAGERESWRAGTRKRVAVKPLGRGDEEDKAACVGACGG